MDIVSLLPILISAVPDESSDSNSIVDTAVNFIGSSARVGLSSFGAVAGSFWGSRFSAKSAILFETLGATLGDGVSEAIGCIQDGSWDWDKLASTASITGLAGAAGLFEYISFGMAPWKRLLISAIGSEFIKETASELLSNNSQDASEPTTNNTKTWLERIGSMAKSLVLSQISYYASNTVSTFSPHYNILHDGNLDEKLDRFVRLKKEGNKTIHEAVSYSPKHKARKSSDTLFQGIFDTIFMVERGIALLNRQDEDGINKLCAVWGAGTLYRLRGRVSVTNQDCLQNVERAIFAPTHSGSTGEISWYFYLLGGRHNFTIGPIVKKEFATKWYYRWLLGRGMVKSPRFIFLDRQNSEAAKKSLNLAAEKLSANNVSHLIYPEGTRRSTVAHDGKFHEVPRNLKKGAANLSLESGLPIVPIRSNGFGYAQPKGFDHPFIRYNTDVEVDIGDTIRPGNFSNLDRNEAVLQMTNRMNEYYNSAT